MSQETAPLNTSSGGCASAVDAPLNAREFYRGFAVILNHGRAAEGRAHGPRPCEVPAHELAMYSHVAPGMQQDAAATVAALVGLD